MKSISISILAKCQRVFRLTRRVFQLTRIMFLNEYSELSTAVNKEDNS